MSLIIKGVEMPCMCCVCPCHNWDMEANRYYCQALKDEPRIIDENTRRDDCPLIEIPAPHGQLIDADDIDSITVVTYPNTGDPFVAGRLKKIIAPPIIEAEAN